MESEEIKINFFNALSDCNPNGENISFIVINGEGSGEKALFSEGSAVFMSKQNGFLAAHSEELKNFNRTGIFTIKNSLIYAETITGKKKEIK